MKRWRWLFICLLVTGCSAPAPTTPPKAETAPAPTPSVEATPAPSAGEPAPHRTYPPGTAVPWSELTQALKGDTWPWRSPSPNERWNAVRIRGARPVADELWLLAADQTQAWLVEPELREQSGPDPIIRWTPENTLLYYVKYARGQRDTWFEFDPASGKSTPYLPDIFSGRVATHWIPAPDGHRYLITADRCDGCNKPSARPVTTYELNLATRSWREIGVDIQAEWGENGEVKAVAQPPALGYSGAMIHEIERNPGPLTLSLQAGGTDYVEWRAYWPDQERPFKVIPGVNHESNYHTWHLWWGDPPAAPFRLELWAEVRPTVPAEVPNAGKGWFTIREESGKRWSILYAREVPAAPSAEAPKQTVAPISLHMDDPQNGWAVDGAGRILRTANGGATWRNVSPPELQRCAGRLYQRQVEWFDAQRATLAFTCDRTGPDGKWTAEGSRLTILLTTDAGRTWHGTDLQTDYGFVTPKSLRFTDDRTGWLVVQPKYPEPSSLGALYRTTDGGRTWAKITDTEAGLPSATVDPTRGWALGPDHKTLWSSPDGGKTWQERTPAPTDPINWLTLPTFLDAQTGYFVANGYRENGRFPVQHLYWTADAGQTWTRRSEWEGYGTLTFLTNDLGYNWDYELRKVSWTRDGGRTWEERQWEHIPYQGNFVDDRHGFAIKDHLWITDDGGATWTARYPRAE